MRRPPDKDNPAVTDRDVDTSNATLNTLFGAKQKSWMLAPRGAPVRPTPRTSTSKSSAPQVTSQQRISILPSPSPSVEPSPILSNTSISNASRTNNENQRPNTTQRPPTSANPTLSSSTPQEAPNSRARPSPKQYIQPLQTQGSEVRNSALPTATTPSIASPVSTFLPGPTASDRTSQPLQSPTLPQSPTLSDINAALAETQSPPQIQTSSHASVTYRPTSLQNAEPQASRARNQAPSPIRINSSSPRTNFATMPNQNQSQPIRSGSSASPNPNKRQRTQPPSMPPLKPRVALINAHIASVGGMQNLNNGLERPRFQLLTEACENEDSFYVVLHQLFCVWDLNRQEVVNVSILPSGQHLLFAFRILGNLIRDNDGLAPTHLKWFAEFPSPLADLLKTSEPYRRTVQHVGVFLGKLALEWANLSKEFSLRCYPPLVDELVTRMGLLSPFMQQVVFTATRRNLGIGDDSIGREMEALFLNDRKSHQELAARWNSDHPPAQKEIDERNNKLIQEYLTLYARHIQNQQKGLVGPERNPLAHITNSNPQPSAQNTGSSSHRSSMAQNQAVWIQNAQNPDMSGGWNYANAQTQSGRAASGSPNPNPPLQLASAHPASVVDQRAYGSLSSPNMMQNLSMQSPVLQQQNVQWPTPVLRSNSDQIQPAQNAMAYGNPNPNGMGAQNGENVDPRVINVAQNQYAIQQQQQVRQAPIQQQPRQWPQQLMPYGASYQQPAQYVQPQHPVPQQLLAQQQQQQQMALQQQVIGMNRAAQLRTNSISGQQQPGRRHSRDNSVSSNGRPSPLVPSQPKPVHNGLPPQNPNPAELKQYNQLVLQQNTSRQLIPPLGYVNAAQPVNPDMTALHQANVRSPRLVPADFEPSVGPEEDPSRRFYQTVRGFAVEPIKIPITSSLLKIEFSISEHDYALIPRDKWPTTDRLPTREYKHGTLQYRLRCIQTKREPTRCLLSDWVISETVWPESIFMEVNDGHLEVRRKTHHGKDLPVDITRFIVPPDHPLHGSVNRAKIAIPRLRKAKESYFFIAVEVIEILQHNEIMKRCTQSQRIPAAQTLATMKKALSGGDDDDDDFAMVTSDLSVDLADPFTARIFDIPVRGKNCLHRECFDLETWLLTRTSKPKRPSQPCMIDVWKCPLCGKDARPYNLEIIDFFADVRAKLAQDGNLDVKAILIKADGSWRPKPEPQPAHKRKKSNGHDNDDDSSDDETVAKKAAATARVAARARQSSAHQAPIEIIDLDD